MKTSILKDLNILFLALFVFSAALYFHKQAIPPYLTITKQQSSTNFDKDFLKVISIGNKRLLSSTIWIKTLLDSDFEHYNKKDKNNWMYHRFTTIASLDQMFYQNYLWGGMYLGIVKDDIDGAIDIYEMGLIQYPEDYGLLYNAGFTYYFEKGDFKNGFRILKKIETHPKTPLPLRFVIAKLKFEIDKDVNAAEEMLKFNITRIHDPVVKAKLEGDLYALIAENDLNCLNSKKVNCASIDPEGNPYKNENGKWVAPKTYRPYKLFLPQR